MYVAFVDGFGHFSCQCDIFVHAVTAPKCLLGILCQYSLSLNCVTFILVFCSCIQFVYFYLGFLFSTHPSVNFGQFYAPMGVEIAL